MITSMTLSYLATSWCVPLNSGGFTNVLMVTTTVGMFNRVHSNTTNNWP